jgi:hypothetical protein
MDGIFKNSLFLVFTFLLMVGCTNTENVSESEPSGIIQVDPSEHKELHIRWGDGTLTVIDNQTIIEKYAELINGQAFIPVDEDANGYLYFITIGDLSINSLGRVNGEYMLNNMEVLEEIERLLDEYLPEYNDGTLE